MHAQQAYAARNRKLDERPLGKGAALAQPQPHKERALWNFLTWSFFIAQVLAAEQFIGAQAKAAENLDLSSSDPNAIGTTLTPESLASLDSTASASDDIRPSLGGSREDLSFQSLDLGQFGDSVIDLDAIAVARAADVSQSIVVAGHSADTGSTAASDTPGDPLPDVLVDVVLPDILDVVGDVTGPLLDTVEDIVATLTGIVGGIADPLLGTVGDVVGAVDDVVADLTQPLNSVLDLTGAATSPVTVVLDVTNELTDTVQNVVGTAGQLTFPLLNLAGLDNLFNNGRYTEYNIELQTGSSASSGTTASDPAKSVPDVVIDVVDHVVDTAARPLDDMGRHLAHLVDDLGSRDGLL